VNLSGTIDNWFSAKKINGKWLARRKTPANPVLEARISEAWLEEENRHTH